MLQRPPCLSPLASSCVTDSRLALLLTFTQEYSEAGAVALESALRHSRRGASVTVGTVDLTDASARRLRSIAERHACDLAIRDLSGIASLFPTVGRYPPLAWTRTFATEVLPAATSRAIYLDADVIVRAPLEPLMVTDMGIAAVGAVLDDVMPTHGDRGADYVRAVGSGERSPYFNSGVLLIDTAAWKALRVGERVLEILDRRLIPIDFIDQDALNAVFSDGWHELDSTWNTLATEAAGDPHIVQFPSGVKPWETPASGRFVDEYRRIVESLP